MSLVSACGRLGFEARTGGDGGGNNGEGPVFDAPCAGAWGPPQHLAALATSTNDRGPALSADGLSMYFHTGASPTVHLATRASTADLFTSAVDVVIAGAGSSRDPHVSRDGTRLYFVDAEILVAQGSGTSFGAPTPLPGVSFQAQGPWLDADELELFYTGSGAILYRAERSAINQPFGAGLALDELVTTTTGWASLTADRLTIFSEGRNANNEVVMATRPDRSARFSTPVTVPELGPEISDPEISADGSTIVFGAPGPGGADDLYLSTRACP